MDDLPRCLPWRDGSGVRVFRDGADGECRGELARCGEALWRALEATVVELETEFGTPDVDAWQRTSADLAIPSTMLGAAPLTQNRAPFEQLVELGSARDRDPVGVPAAGGRDQEDDSVPWVPIAVGSAVAVGIGLFLVRRLRRRSRA